MKKKILVLTYYWPPAGGAGVQRWMKFSKYLVKKGYDLTVVTVDPDQANYPQTDTSLALEVQHIKVIRTATSEPFKAYKKVTAKKETPYGGFSNETGKSLKEELAKFIRGNFFLPDARKGWNKYAVEAAAEIIRRENTDVLITTSPPHSTQLAGKKLKKEFPHLFWIADLRDPWTGIYYYNELYPTLPAKMLDKAMERSVVRHADKLITVSENIRNEFAANSGELKKIHVIPNGYDEDDFTENHEKESQFTITYTGTISSRYPIDAFLQSIHQVKQQTGSLPLLRFVGTVPGPVKQKILEGFAGVTDFTGQVNHDQAVKLMQQSSLLLLLIPDTPGNKGILTGKLFEYIGSGTPILCIGPEDGEAAAIIKKTGAGVTIDPSRTEAIAGAIAEIRDKGFRSERKGELFSRRVLTDRLISLFEEA